MKYILAGLAAVASASADHYRYMQYIAEHKNKEYSTVEEFAMRFQLWKNADAFITQHNASGEETHTVGHNFLSDYTAAERAQLLGLKDMPRPAKFTGETTKANPAGNPDSVDWVTAGCVTDVKDQGQCGSCWSFSATGGLEGAWCVAGNTLTSLSEQQLVSCSYTEGNLGCNGGWYYSAWEYLKSYMSMTEASYPYTAPPSSFTSCHYDQDDGVTFVSSYTAVATDDPDALKTALVQQPVSVAIEADTATFQYYTSGVITSSNCGTMLDHAVLAVGYGTEDGNEYFLVKNSWAASWGDNGYVKIGVSSGYGTCGINQAPYWVSV